ncbi:hypothetical protein KEJ25_10530 [Candidatus Bathyarchaeota archaeon]|nr:hypothetical protein [Candidatus Bathyarchaeota archaeon]
MLEIAELWKIYKTRTAEYPVLRGVNMKVEKDEFLYEQQNFDEGDRRHEGR